ncbi:hypothetical protein G9A89_006579 [Geosiphon pyriformis]|nr:hypothetical protein G9A89_006579 [Geosiphon pyriformis]
MGAKKELTIAQRNTICLLQQHGKKYRDIANIVNCSLTTVSDTIKRFKETGSIDSRPRSGRQGRSGKTLLCEFRGETIALKTVDLAKAPPYLLEEMQKEVEIYESLADIQGQYIPKLVCHGYYGGGMCFIIGLTIVGTPLDKHKITKQQSSRALKALEAIHKHGILQNDIREENILVDDSGDIYLIDFGIASRADIKKERKLFEEEQMKLSRLLNEYTVMPPQLPCQFPGI